jgi:hypothetical protein
MRKPAFSHQLSFGGVIPFFADNGLLSQLSLLIINIYQHDSNIPFDQITITAQNHPPWLAANRLSSRPAEAAKPAKLLFREETFFPRRSGFQERTRYGYNSREHCAYGRFSGKSPTYDV